MHTADTVTDLPILAYVVAIVLGGTCHPSIHPSIHACMHIDIYIQIQIHMQTCIHAYTDARLRACSTLSPCSADYTQM